MQCMHPDQNLRKAYHHRWPLPPGYSVYSLDTDDDSGRPLTLYREGAVVAWWLGCWTHDSRVVVSIPTLGMVHFWGLGNFIYPHLPQYTQLQMGTNVVGKVPAMD